MATNRKKTIKEMEAEWDNTPSKDSENTRRAGKTIKEMEAEWDSSSTQRNAGFAVGDFITIKDNLPGLTKSYADKRYKLGGSAEIRRSGIIPQYGQYEKYAPIISNNFAMGKDYLGLTDDEVAEYQAYMQQMAKDSVWGGKLATARTGGLDAIDMSGMPKAQQRELRNMGNLSQTDDVYAALSQTAAETQKPNIWKLFDDPNQYAQFVASGASMPGAEQKNLFGETVTNDDQLSVLLGERKTYDDYLKMYSAYPSEALRKDLMNIQSYNTKRNVYAVTPEQYEASRARVYAATGTDYDSIARESGGTDNKWMLDALGNYEAGEKYLAENVFGEVSEEDWYRYHDAYMNYMESSSRQGNKLDTWEEEADRQTNAQLNASDGIDYYRPAPMYLNIDPTYLEGHREYQNEDGAYMPAEEYRGNAINEWLMAYVDAGNDEAKIKALDEARGEYLPELEQYNLDKLRYLDPDQQKAIFTAFNNGDVETAKNLIQTYDPILNYQRSRDVIKAWEQKYNEANTAEKIGMNVQSVGQNVGTALEGVKQAIWSVVAPEELEKITAYDPVYDKTRKANKTIELTGGEIAQATNGVNIPFADRNLIEAIYYGVMSGADSFAIGNLFAPFGPAAQAIAMGGISFANERMGKLEAGYSESDANMDAWIQSFIEGVTEYIPFDIMSKNSPHAWRKALGGIYAGSVGEGVSELGGALYDEIKYGDYRDQLLVEGNRGSEASLWLKWLEHVGPDVASAMIGGLVGEAPMQIVSASSENRQNKTFGENLRTNDGVDLATDLVESLPVSDDVKDIARRWKAERAAEKGSKTDAAVEDSASVTKADADAAVKETEQIARDKAERAEDGKANTEPDAAAVTKADAEAAVKEVEQTARDKGKRKGEKKRGSKPVSNAELGYMYRQAMEHLDEGARNIMAESFSRDVIETDLAKAGFRGDMRKAADAVTKFISGDTSKRVLDAINSNATMRSVALDYTAARDISRAALYSKAGELAYRASKDYVKPEATKAEKGAQEATQGVDDRAAISAEDIEVSDVPESTVDGKAVTIEGVASVAEDGSVTYTVKDADGNVSEVSETDVAYGQNDAGIAAVAQNAKELGANADSMLKAYNSEQNAAEYSAAFKQAVQYGDDGRNLDAIKNDSALSTLTEQQIEIAYNIGRGVRTGRNDAMVRKNASGVKVGQVDISGVDFKSLTKHQRTSVHTMSRLAKAAGFNIRFVESKANAEGKYTTENGSWDPETLTLTLDVHAGSNKKSDVNYAMMHTAGHELTHYIRQFADTDMWNAYQEFVIGHLSTKEDGVFNLEDRINKQIEGARKKGRNLTRDGAIEEIIANASGEALNSISEADIQALAETNPSLLNKVKQFFQRWIKSVKAAIKAAYSDTEAKTAEAKMMMDDVDEMGKRWNELFVNAAKNRASENVASETTTTNTEMQDLEHAHIDQRTFDSVADTNTTLFCSEVEEAQIGMAAAANILLADLENSIPGQKVWLADNEVTGQKRQTSELLGRMKDELGLTWDGLRQRLQQFAGMEDADQLPKNNLNNRRIELYLNEMLTEGYTTLDGTKVNAWDGYIDAMQGYEGADAQKKYSPIAGAVDFTDYAWPGDVMYDDRKKYSERVTDEDTLDFLNNQKTVTTYKTMQLVDGKLYPPMAAVVAGKYEDASELGTWEATVEHPELIKWGDDGKAYFKLDKGQKRGSLDARYNPYMHSSNLVLNDQFTGAYARDNLVTVQCEVPVSELNSGYHAEHAKDPVGWHPWHAGPVAGTLRNVTGTERQVLLSRWIKPVRIVPDSEVAAMYKELLDGTGITVPENVVPPGLKAELEKAGVPLAPKDEAKKLNDALKKGKKGKTVKYDDRMIDSAEADEYNYSSIKWATDGLLDVQEQAQLYAALSEITERSYKAFLMTSDGEYMIPVESAIIFSNGDKVNPTISAVVKLHVSDPADTISILKERFKNGERSGDFDKYEAWAVIQSLFRDGTAEILRPGIRGKNHYVEYGRSGASSRETSGRGKSRKGQESVARSLLREQTDSDGNRLTFAQKDYFADSKARDENGRLLVMYHGTSNYGFTVFDTYNSRYGLMGMGSYFTDNKEVAEGYTKKGRGNSPGVYSVYLNIKNPIDMDAVAGYKLAKAWEDYFSDYLATDDVITGDMTNERILRVIENALKYEEVTMSEAAELFDGFYRANGFDGITHVGGKRYGSKDGPDHRVYIAFDPEQAKRTDNDAPTDDPDMRYQERDFSELSDRELLVNALESELTPAERDHLERYKTKVDKLGEDQGKLEKLTSRIVELKNAGYTAKTSVELRVAETNATTLRRRIDREDAKLKEIESATMIKEVIKRNREAARKEAYTLARQRADERQRKAVEHAREVGERRVQRLKESQGKEKYKKRILEDVKKLHTWVASPTNKGSVPEFLREPLAEFIDSIDFRSGKALSAGKALETGAAEEWLKQATQRRDNAKVRYDKALAEYEEIKKTGTDEQIKKAKRKMSLAKGNYEIEARAVEQGIEASAMEYTAQDKKFTEALDKVREAVSKLNKQYAGLEKGKEAFEKFIDLPADYADEFDGLVRDIKDALENGRDMTDTPFNRMTGNQLKEMAKMFRVLKSSIQNVNRFVANTRYESAREAANHTIDDANELKARIKTNKTLELLNSTFNWKNTTPYYVFQRLGRGGKAVFEALQDGWDKMAYNSARVIKHAKDTFNEKESKAWSSEIDTIELDSGETVQMTTAQKMSLYCHTKREQSRGHLMGGGIRISDIDGKHGMKISQAENYVLTENDIARIIDSLTDRQIEVADALQRFMNTVCAEWGNEISMKRFGFEQMTEKNYFPIKTDGNNRASIDESKEGGASMFRLLNMSSLKPITPGAKNAIIIEDIFNVFSDHASDMAKYNSLALPILDFIKWYNFVERNDVIDDNGNPTGQHTTRSTQKALERAFGQDAKSYLRTFIKDLNAEHDGGRNDHIINRLTNRAKIASVGANMRVYMLQLTSIPRAAYAINIKYLVQGAANLRIGGDKVADKVGILKWKDLGFFSTEINRNVRTMVRQDESKWDKARNIQMKPAEWGDKLTANIIYNAVKAEIADKHPEIKAGTEMYDVMVNERVREIIYKTQVVDSTMTRSELMRSRGMMATFTSFMSEPTLTVNMLNESVQEAIYKKRGGKLDESDLTPGKKAAKAWSVFIVGGVITSLVASVVDAFRDDDEYEKWSEKYVDALINNAIDAVNIPSMLPVVAEFAEAAEAAIKGQDYTPSTLTMQSITNLVSTINGLREYYEGKRTLPNVIYSALKTLSYSTGFGMYNATRDAVAVYNTAIANGTTLPKIQSWRDNKSKAAKAMYKAAMAHDTEEFDKLAARAALYGIEPEDLEGEYNKLISADYLAGDISADEAKRMIKLYGGKTPYQAQTVLDKLDYQKKYGEKFSDVERNYVSGKIAKADAKAALTQYGEMTASEADAKVLTWDYEKATGRKYSNISSAYLRGEMTRNEIKNAMTKYGGKDAGEAEASILHLDYQIKTERPWSELMNDYHKGKFTSGQAKKFHMDYDGKDEYEAEDIVEKYDWAKLHGGSTEGYSKYVTVHEAIDSGRDITDAMEALVDKYAARGKSRKDTLSAIRSSITSKYKPIYLASSEAEQARMREQLLDVYVQLGGKYSTYYKNMTKGWFED